MLWRAPWYLQGRLEVDDFDHTQYHKAGTAPHTRAVISLRMILCTKEKHWRYGVSSQADTCDDGRIVSASQRT